MYEDELHLLQKSTCLSLPSSHQFLDEEKNCCSQVTVDLHGLYYFRLEQMSRDAQLYISRNQTKFEATAKALLAKPSLKQRLVRNWNKLITQRNI